MRTNGVETGLPAGLPPMATVDNELRAAVRASRTPEADTAQRVGALAGAVLNPAPEVSPAQALQASLTHRW